MTSDSAAVPADDASRTLVLLRHGKAEQWSDSGDLGRALSNRGRADAEAAGRWLSDHDIDPDVVLCSPSTRTQQTWESVAAGGKLDGELHVDRRIYEAGIDSLLEVIAEVDAEARTVLMVGHAPGIPGLAWALADDDASDQRALARLGEHFPTSALAVLAVPCDWAQLGEDSAQLTAFESPRG